MKTSFLNLQEVADCDFGELFSFAMRTYSIMCLGIYRLKDTSPRSKSRKRFVITLPPNKFRVLPSDKIFVLVPFNMKLSVHVRSQQPLIKPRETAKSSRIKDMRNVATQTEQEFNPTSVEIVPYTEKPVKGGTLPRYRGHGNDDGSQYYQYSSDLNVNNKDYRSDSIIPYVQLQDSELHGSVIADKRPFTAGPPGYERRKRDKKNKKNKSVTERYPMLHIYQSGTIDA